MTWNDGRSTSVRIIKIVEQLPNTRAGNHVACQLLRSGTSPYPNRGEAQAAESTNDSRFIK
ncbi:four helix bundle protein [Thermodesulfobacteriota bacterium]